jgi:hypothetical protein
MIEIPISSSRDKIFEQYLYLINPILGKNKLTDLEMKVLSKMLQVFYLYSHLGVDSANAIVFHAETKKRIREVISKELGSIYSVQSFNNVIYKLKMKGMITADKLLISIPYKDGKIKLVFNLSVNE